MHTGVEIAINAKFNAYRFLYIKYNCTIVRNANKGETLSFLAYLHTVYIVFICTTTS